MTKHSKLYAEYSAKLGQTFDGMTEHWSERETVKPIYAIRGEILEVKASGICVDDGKGDEVFVSFDTIAKHRAQLFRDYKSDSQLW